MWRAPYTLKFDRRSVQSTLKSISKKPSGGFIERYDNLLNVFGKHKTVSVSQGWLSLFSVESKRLLASLSKY